MAACWPPPGLEVRLPHSRGIPALPFHDRMTRLVGASAGIGPAAPGGLPVLPAAPPVSVHEASQLGVAAMVPLPKPSKPRPPAGRRPGPPARRYIARQG